MKRIGTLALSLILLVGLLAAAIPTAAAAQIEATEEDTILIAFSDFQDKSGIASGKATLQKLVNTLKNHGLKTADGVFMVGDLNASGSYTNESTISTNKQSIQAIKDVFSPYVGDNILFAQGNHDLAATPGLAPAGNNDPASGAYGVYVIPEDQYGEWGNTPNETKQAAADLKAYLDAKASSGWTKPIFVVNHIPLHWGNRTMADGSGSQGYQLVDVLNEGGTKGLNIIYLFGHNHSSGYDDFLGSSAIYLKKGDQMEVAHGTKYQVETETIQFTYLNAGYVGYNSSKDANADTALTLTAFLIRGDEVIITRYDVNGVHNLKSKGIWNASYSQEGYHATPNPTVYASSRKVTADSDVEVEPPYYSQKPAPTTTTTTTTTTTAKVTTRTKAPTATTTAAKTAAATTAAPITAAQPTEATAAPTVTEGTAAPTTATAIPADPIGTGTPSTEAPTVTEAPSEPISSATATLAPSQDADTSASADEKPFPIGWVIGIGGAVLVVAGVVLWLVLKRKK